MDAKENQAAVADADQDAFAPGELTNWLTGGGDSGGMDTATAEKIDSAIDAGDTTPDDGDQGQPDGDYVEVQFGQDKFSVPKADEQHYRKMETAFKGKQSEADRATESAKRLETQLNALSAQFQAFMTNGSKASTGPGSEKTGDTSPAGRQSGPVDDILAEAKELDDNMGASGKLVALFEKMNRANIQMIENTGVAVRRDVDRVYGETAAQMQLQDELPIKVAEQLRMDAEDPIIGAATQIVDPDELAASIFSEVKSAKKAGKPWNIKEIYLKQLLASALGQENKQVSSDEISGGAKPNGAGANGQRQPASNGKVVLSGGLRRLNGSSRIPAAMRTSQEEWSAQRHDAEMASAFKNPSRL